MEKTSLVRKAEARKIKNDKACTVWEYGYGKILGLALAKIDGRFPQEGAVVNEACEEAYYVVNGSGTIHYDGSDFKLKAGDAFFILPNKKYWIEGKGLTIVVPSSPNWYQEQHKYVK